MQVFQSSASINVVDRFLSIFSKNWVPIAKELTWEPMTTLIVTMTVGPDRPRGEVQARTTVRNLDSVLRFQQRVLPTILVSNRLISSHIPCFKTDERTGSRECFRQSACELGITLEPLTTPPFDANEDRLKEHTANSIPPYAVVRKMASLVNRFEEAIGHAPIAHRVGIRSLRRDGPDPGGAWCHRRYGVAPSRMGAKPGASIGGRAQQRHTTPTDNAQPTEAHHPSSRSPHLWLRPRYTGATCQIAGRQFVMAAHNHFRERWVICLWALVGLAPGQYQLAEMQRLVDARIRAAVPHLILEVASASLQPGESAHSMSAAEATQNFEAIDAMFRYVIDRHHLKATGLIDFAREYVRPGLKPD